jgi:hypothetical protein
MGERLYILQEDGGYDKRKKSPSKRDVTKILYKPGKRNVVKYNKCADLPYEDIEKFMVNVDFNPFTDHCIGAHNSRLFYFRNYYIVAIPYNVAQDIQWQYAKKWQQVCAQWDTFYGRPGRIIFPEVQYVGSMEWGVSQSNRTKLAQYPVFDVPDRTALNPLFTNSIVQS